MRTLGELLRITGGDRVNRNNYLGADSPILRAAGRQVALREYQRAKIAERYINNIRRTQEYQRDQDAYLRRYNNLNSLMSAESARAANIALLNKMSRQYSYQQYAGIAQGGRG